MDIDYVAFLNPKTCGIYKSGGVRYKTDPLTGTRTDEVDNELLDAVEDYLNGVEREGTFSAPLTDVFASRVLVPTYYDERHNQGIYDFLEKEDVEGISLGSLIDDGVLTVRGGHGSPGNDQRQGTIPYIKVSDIRGLRVNINPTNLVSETIAHRFWRGETSGICPWDLITPNRASSNIGELAIILPGEENVVLTKEMFVFRVVDNSLFDPFYLLWAFSLGVVREQWRRIVLMQTNREDCGQRYREIILPYPEDKQWAQQKSKAFCDYFSAIAKAKTDFSKSLDTDPFEYIANVQ